MMMPVSTYYYQKKPDKNEDWLVDQMSKVIEDFPGCGYRTINIELRKKGLLLNHKKIQRLMRENKLTSKRIIKFKGKTTDSVHDLKKYKESANTIQRDWIESGYGWRRDSIFRKRARLFSCNAYGQIQ
ncbi:HTH-like domain protein [Leptospira noguchii str. 1993005606]|uniref:IS3 family transposase n=1 Tax=Leptospira noguchii TaxID=28182 RepID=UPI0003542E52|nr:IS3 family transposase [Leptospira noguchii]EPE86710.1 HTH-like domain protein [Leptospira noguchii str. 1993005606]